MTSARGNLARSARATVLGAFVVLGAAPWLGHARIARAQDAAEIDTTYQAGLDAFAAGEYERAAEAFERVAATTTDAGRRAAAQELARQARARAAQTSAQDAGAVDAGVPAAPDAGADGATPAAADAGAVRPIDGAAWAPPPEEVRPPPAPPGYAADTEPLPEPPRARLRNPGRLTLVTGTTLLGLAAWGWLTPVSLGLEDDARAMVGLYMVVAAGSFFGPYLATRNADVSWGAATLAINAGLRGLGHGALLYLAFAGDDGDEQAILGTMTLMSLAELAAAYAWADLTGMSAGTAHAVTLGADVGMLWTVGGALLFAGEDLEAQPAAGLAVLGVIGGTVAGRLFAEIRSWTWGDAEVVQMAGLLGIYTGMVPLVITETDDDRAIAAVLMAAHAAGLVIGDRVVDGVSVTTGQSLLVDLGAIAGGLLGAGLGWLILGEEDGDLDDDEAKAVLSIAALTAWGGGALTFVSLDIDEERRRGGPPRETRGGPTVSLAPWVAREGRGLALAGSF